MIYISAYLSLGIALLAFMYISDSVRFREELEGFSYYRIAWALTILALVFPALLIISMIQHTIAFFKDA